ncbi:MAG: adaptor protein MecA [Clostridiales bacterium]|jgi:adapter protein MecA 1/2|nr:adaptor protein MecA [Clostridiales bacterium]
MKVERISENQVKFILTPSDLAEHDMKISELAVHPEKIHMLFHDMLEQAMEECGFQIDDAALIIEAMPSSLGGIMIIVTKIPGPPETTPEFPAHYTHVGETRQRQKFAQEKTNGAGASGGAESDNMLIFSFNSLSLVGAAARRLRQRFSGLSSLYKNEGRYFLVLQRDRRNLGGELTNAMLEAVLAEYGCKHVSNQVAKSYLSEYGEMLIADWAMSVMAENDF